MTTVTHSPGCCCPPDTGGGCQCSCCPDGFWTQYTFSISGVINGDPGCSCGVVNGDWIVRYVGGCTWHTDELDLTGSPCTDGGPIWIMQCVPLESRWALFNSESGETYSATFAEFNCIDGGTFTLETPPPAPNCTSFPATVTLSPAGVFVPCP